MDDRDEQPVPTALVRLVDEDGEQQAVSIADSAGLYRVEVPSPGVYRLEAARIGFENFETPLLEVTNPDGVYPVDLLMRAAPVELPGFTVMTDRPSREQMDRAIRLMLGTSPQALRSSPIEFDEIQGHISRGHNLEDLLRWQSAAGVVVSYTTEGPCFSLRGRGCLPVYLNGMHLNRDFMVSVPLDMIYSIVIVTPGDPVAPWVSSGIMLYTEAWLR